MLPEQICGRKHIVAATLSTNTAAVIAPSILQSATRTIVGDLSDGINSVSTHRRKSPSTHLALQRQLYSPGVGRGSQRKFGKHAFFGVCVDHRCWGV